MGGGKIVKSIASSMFDEGNYVFGELYAFFIASFMTLEGELDIERFKSSLKKALDCYPVLKSRYITSTFRSRWQVDQSPDIDSIVEVHNIEGADSEEKIADFRKRFVNRRIDVNKELPLRFQVLRGAGKTFFGMVIHHSLADGRGTVEILNTLRLADEDKLPPGPIVDDRGYCRLLKRFGFREKLRIFKIVLEQVIADAKTPPIVPLAMSMEGDEGDVTYRKIYLPASEFDKLYGNAKMSGSTVNDVLLAAIFHAYDSFNATRNKRGDYGLGIAVNLRPMAGIEGAIANFSGLLGIPMSGNNSTNPITCLAETTKITRYEKERYPGLYTVTVAAMINALMPGALVRLTMRKLFIAYMRKIGMPSALTNIGVVPQELEKIWGLNVSDLYFLAPVIERPSAIYTATTFKGGLTLTVGYRENGLSDTDATEFVGAIETSIKKYC